jgi:hypothetical protein
MTGVRAAWVTWRPQYGTRGVSVMLIGEQANPDAFVPLPGQGRPTTAAMDDRVAALGYTRLGPWTEMAAGLVAAVEPIRPET